MNLYNVGLLFLMTSYSIFVRMTQKAEASEAYLQYF